MFTAIILRLVILEAVLVEAMSETCKRKHPQQYFCQSDIVLRLEILCSRNVPVGYEYITELKEIYKNFGHSLNLTVNELAILKMHKDEVFETGKQYYIFAENKMGKLYTEPCNGNVMVTEKLDFIRKALKHYFNINCLCTNSFGSYTDEMKCHWEYDYKVFHNESCEWNKGDEYKKCVQEKDNPNKRRK